MKNAYLQTIKDRCQQSLQLGHNNLFVFDLDSTLFDVSPRSQKILQDYANVPEITLKFPQETSLLRNIKVSPSDWGVRASVERLPFVSPPSQDFFLGIKTYWTEHFFTSDYLHHDVPYAGAVEFVSHFATHPGNHIAYLTGRDTKRMLIGTERSLAKNGFPLPGSNVSLALKPHTDISDTDFKCDWFHQIEKMNYANIWFFENEPTNIARVTSEHPKVEIIFFDSTHSGKLSSPKHLPTISDYL